MKTRIVTFPRSGHHWLVDGLVKQYSIKYDEHHSTGNTLENSDCEVQKTHDFELNVEKVEGYNHVIQLRNPLRAIESWHKIHNDHHPFPLFFQEKIAFYSKWMQKWVMEPTPNSIIICYEDMLKDYGSILKKVGDFIRR
jgi:hypothetical protein